MFLKTNLGYLSQIALKNMQLLIQTVIFNPIHTGLFCTGGVFHLHPVTLLSFKSDDSNFVQNYSRIGSIFWDKKNRDQIENDVTMTSSLL